MPYARRIRDLLVEILIAAVLVTSFLIYLFQHPKGVSLPWEWIKLVVNTTIVFGFLIAWFRESWRNYVFWVTVAILLLCHVFLLSFFVRPNYVLPGGYYALLINPIELVVFAKILRRIPQTRGTGGRVD